MNGRKFKLITIVGNIASGKSTLTNLLSKNIPAIKVSADKFYITNPFFPMSLDDRKRWSFASDLWFLTRRVEMAEKYADLLKHNYVVVDSGIPMSWIYANTRLKQKFYSLHELRLYEKCFNNITSNLINSDVIINLEAEVPFLFESIKKRNRRFEIRYYNVDYLKEIDNSIKKYLTLFKKKSKIINIKRPETDLLYNHDSLMKLIEKIT